MQTVLTKSLITFLAALAIALSFSGWVDQQGQSYTEQGLKRALLTYGVARGLNGVISVAQGTEFAFEPLGVGLTLAPGQILDPVNDLVERFSWVVLASGASLGVQKIMISISSWLWFSLMVSLLLVISVFFIWQKKIVSQKLSIFFYKAAVILFVLRFAIPAIAIINEGLFEVFLAPQYEQAKQSLQYTSNALEQINSRQPLQASDLSFVEKIQQQYQSAVSALDLEQRLAELKEAVADVSESALNMIVVFVMQTLILPLLFLWLTVKLIKAIFIFQFSPHVN